MAIIRHRRPTRRFWSWVGAFVILMAAILAFSSHHALPKQQRSHSPQVHPFHLTAWALSPVTLSQPMAAFSALHVGHAIWILGGVVNGSSSTLIQQLNVTTKGLGPIKVLPRGLPVPTHDAAVVASRNHLWLLGGGTNQADPSVFSLPLPKLSPATSLTALPTPLAAFGAVALARHHILLVGGQSNRGLSSAIWDYAPHQAASLWAHLPTSVRNPAVARGSHFLYVVGGLSPTGVTRQAVRYNLQSKQMTVLAPYPLATEAAEAAVVSHTLVVAGGSTPSGYTQQVFWYDAKTNSWRASTSLPSSLSDGCLLAAPHHRLLWIGGESPSGALDNIWVSTWVP